MILRHVVVSNKIHGNVKVHNNFKAHDDIKTRDAINQGT